MDGIDLSLSLRSHQMKRDRTMGSVNNNEGVRDFQTMSTTSSNSHSTLPRGRTILDMISAYTGQPEPAPGQPLPSFLRDPFACRDFARLRDYVPRLAFSFGFYGLCMYLDCMSQAYLQHTMSTYYQTHWKPVFPEKHNVTLWDLGHQCLPRIDLDKHPWMSPDTLAMLGPNYLAIRFFVIPGPMSLRWTIMCRWSTLVGVLFLARGFSILSTVLPNPDHECVPMISHPNNLPAEALAIFLAEDVTCQDVLYSGHTVAITLSALFIAEYSGKSPWFVRSLVGRYRVCSLLSLTPMLLVVYVLVGWYVIIASRFHYTADVFIGALLTVFVFKTYHAAIKLIPVRQDVRCSIYPFLSWFERDAPDMKLWKQVALRRVKAVQEADAEVARDLIEEAPPLDIIHNGVDKMMSVSLHRSASFAVLDAA